MSLPALASPEKNQIRCFFDSIAERYDFLNSLLSFRLDESWRSKSAELLLQGKEQSILDLGTGTGKFLKVFLDRHPFEKAVGVDFSEGMLEKARKELGDKAEFINADFHHLPFLSESFDLIVSAFALRSVKNVPQFMNDLFQILKPHGRLGVLCLTRPQNRILRWGHSLYLNFYLPIMGRLVSGQKDAYLFLSQSVQNFQDPSDTLQAMQNAGFRNVHTVALSGCIATLFVGEKQ